jgi:hypothetical protein
MCNFVTRRDHGVIPMKYILGQCSQNHGEFMATMKYFAYGSNMGASQMSLRCPHSLELGLGILRGHRFRINGRGVATVNPDPSGVVHGVVWELPREDEEILDSYEGVPRIYSKRIVQIEFGGTMESMLIYISRDGLKGRPRPGYLERILGAAEGRGMAEGYVEELRAWMTRC